jgi:hypothetical protein
VSLALKCKKSSSVVLREYLLSCEGIPIANKDKICCGDYYVSREPKLQLLVHWHVLDMRWGIGIGLLRTRRAKTTFNRMARAFQFEVRMAYESAGGGKGFIGACVASRTSMLSLYFKLC